MGDVPIMLGATQQPEATAGQAHFRLQSQGLKMISMGLLIPAIADDLARADAAQRDHAISAQRGVGELDYLIIDLPRDGRCAVDADPDGWRLTGAVLVTTPSTVALADVRKAIECPAGDVEVLGVVENMSTFACPHCARRWIFLATVRDRRRRLLMACRCLAKWRSIRGFESAEHRQAGGVTGRRGRGCEESL